MTRLTENSVLNTKNKSWSVTAEVVVPEQGANGKGPMSRTIIAQGGAISGWSFYVKDGKAKFTYNNLLGLQMFTTEAKELVPPGKHQVRSEFAYDGGGVAEPLEPMQNGVEHPVRPLHAPSGQLPNSPLEDGVAVAVIFGQDRQDDRGRGSGYQVLVDLHDFPRRAALTNSNPSVHSNTIHGSVMYLKRNLTTRLPHSSAPVPQGPAK